MKTTKITTIFLGMASAMAFAQEGSACIPFVNGTGNYDKHCYNEGLIDMEEGKCYTFNPARVTEGVQLWVNNMASQTWWWVETPCIEEVSSSSVEPESNRNPAPAKSLNRNPALAKSLNQNPAPAKRRFLAPVQNRSSFRIALSS